MENINVCIRFRPILDDNSNLITPNLFKVEGNSILNLKSKDILSFGMLYNIKFI